MSATAASKLWFRPMARIIRDRAVASCAPATGTAPVQMVSALGGQCAAIVALGLMPSEFFAEKRQMPATASSRWAAVRNVPDCHSPVVWLRTAPSGTGEELVPGTAAGQITFDEQGEALRDGDVFTDGLAFDDVRHLGADKNTN